MTRLFFDARELYFLTQFVPVYRVLRERGVECTFVAYDNRSTHRASIRRGFEELELPTAWVGTKEDGLELYKKEAPDWILFGRGYAYARELPPTTSSGQLYHGIGMKTDVFAPSLVAHDVRFAEGRYYGDRIRSMFPTSCVVDIGYPKIDPMLCEESRRPKIDLASVGLDPNRPTVLYAPTHAPSSFPNMSDSWPADFADYNLIVKPHQLSYFGSKRKSHRSKMDLWARSPNVHVVPIEAFDPAPYMNVADVIVSDMSSVVFEFAASGKPVIWCDFLYYHWTRSGPLRYRRWKRMDRPILERFHDIAVHARRYRDLAGLVAHALADPAHGRLERLRMAEELVGPLDGRSSERVADYVLNAPRKRAAGATPALSATR